MIGLHLGLGVLAAGCAAALTWLFWDQAGLGDRALVGSLAAAARPRGLRLFACLAPAVTAWFTSLALGLVLWLAPPAARARRPELPRLLLRLDALAYLALPACAVLPLVWSQLGNGLAALGLIYLGLAAAKAGLLAWALWSAELIAPPEPGRGLGVKRQAAVCLAAWVALAALAGWGHQALSSASDEVGYLLIAHSLARHGASDVKAAVAAGEQESFYWARWSPELAFGAEQARGIFPWLITPAYWLGGRLGVLVFLAGLLALTLGQLLSWLAECRIRPGPAAAAAALTCLATPVLLISQQVFPDTAGMLLLVLGLRLLLRLEDAPWSRGLGLIACALAMAALKSRLAPLAGGLVLVGAAQLMAKLAGWRVVVALAAAALIAAGLMAVFLPQAWWPAWVWPQVDVLRWNLERAYYPLQPVVVLLRGLALDQTFGLLVTAPVFLLALAGAPAGLKFRARPMLQLLVPLAIYVAVLAYTRWFQWYGGFAGPARFLAACLPALSLPLALCLGALSRPWLRLMAWFMAAATLVYAFLINLIAQFRYARPLGVNPLVAALQDHLGLDLHHLLPSTFTRSAALYPWAALALALAAVLAWLTWRDQAAREAPAPAGRPGAPALELTLLPLALVLALLVFLAAGRLWPPGFVEAEQMRRPEAALWAEYAYPNQMRGAVLLDGGRVEGRLFLPGGETVLKAVGWPEADGELVVRLDGAVSRWRWSLHHRELVIPLGGQRRGYRRLELSWSSCPGRSCALLVDRLEALPINSR